MKLYKVALGVLTAILSLGALIEGAGDRGFALAAKAGTVIVEIQDSAQQRVSAVEPFANQRSS